VGFPGEVSGRLSSPPRTHHRSTACTATPRRLPRCAIRLAGRALPQPRKASRASQVDRPRSSRRPTATQNKKSRRSIHDGDGRASSPGATKPSLECAGVCCLDAVPRDLCARALPTRSRPSPALWLLHLSSLKHSVGRLPWGGSSSAASASLSPQRRTSLSLSRRCAVTAAQGQAPLRHPFCCGTLLLSPSPEAASPTLVLASGLRPLSLCATPHSPPRPRIPCGVRVTAAWAWGSLRLRLLPGCGLLLSLPRVNGGECTRSRSRPAALNPLGSRRGPVHAACAAPLLHAATAWPLVEADIRLNAP
jgi:hypothetical protein